MLFAAGTSTTYFPSCCLHVHEANGRKDQDGEKEREWQRGRKVFNLYILRELNANFKYLRTALKFCNIYFESTHDGGVPSILFCMLKMKQHFCAWYGPIYLFYLLNTQKLSSATKRTKLNALDPIPFQTIYFLRNKQIRQRRSLCILIPFFLQW